MTHQRLSPTLFELYDKSVSALETAQCQPQSQRQMKKFTFIDWFINQTADIFFNRKSLESARAGQLCDTMGSLPSCSQELFHVSPLRPLSGCRWFQLKYLSLNVVKPAFSGQEMPAVRAWCHREHKDLQCVYLLLINCFLNTFELYPPCLMVLRPQQRQFCCVCMARLDHCV